ncbi:MAG TPA: arginine--tRNA ligase [Bacteroidia bacterium]|nr:arginine--tRNA ligase [Bacteroidia bacterium]
MIFEDALAADVSKAIKALYDSEVDPRQLVLQKTKDDFEGDITLVVFALTKISKKSPEETGRAIGQYLKVNCPVVKDFNVVKGFLNLILKEESWLENFMAALPDESFGVKQSVSVSTGKPVLVEYSSPNTNKPLHLGHIRNILLGWSVAELLKAVGNKVEKVNIVNDRGIHICKSMMAWKKFGNGETPRASGTKGDHLVGKYYVEFDKAYKREIEELVHGGLTEEEAEKKSPLMMETREMLGKWESHDKETLELWKLMNGWVYEGFDETYKLLGVDFNKIYYESETYLLGKKIIEEGLQKNIFYKKPDGSVWIDLTSDGLDEKLVLRADGTSVYITQDLGTAELRFSEFHFGKLIFVVGNEQEYHFKVLKLILKKLGYEWAENLFHLSYAMVDLPSGKMKSREGTVVDADELMKQMIDEAEKITKELGKIEDFDSAEAQQLYKTIGLGALKYFILKVDPEKRMLFNPAESIDFNGNTGPFIQYTYARIQSVIRKALATDDIKNFSSYSVISYAAMNGKEKELLKLLLNFPFIVEEAAQYYSPALAANYVFEVSKSFNQFYHEFPIVDKERSEISKFRLQLSSLSARVIKSSMHLLGIDVPERM